MLVRHAPTSATRAAAFPADEPLDERGLDRAGALAGLLPRHAEALTSASRRCRETARAAGLQDAQVVPALAECDFGAWTGRTFTEVFGEDPAGAQAWLADPAATPHGGESHTQLAARVGAWLDLQAGQEGAAVAVTHGGVVKAAVVHALGAPLEALWKVDVAPLSLTELHAHDGRWTVTRVNAEAAA